MSDALKVAWTEEALRLARHIFNDDKGMRAALDAAVTEMWKSGGATLLDVDDYRSRTVNLPLEPKP